MSRIILLAFYIGAFSPVHASSNAITTEEKTEPALLAAVDNFTLAANGVTITCSAAAVGETGDIGGVIYTKRAKGDITPENAATTCTSGITDMSNLFQSQNSFNEDISHWDVSSVINMSVMFSFATSFNQDIGNWNVSKVDNMNMMFYKASAFNQNIGNWDVSNVTDMSTMFNSASVFNQDIGNWNVSKVTNMSTMFYNAIAFNKDIGAWNVSNVTNMSSMFKGASVFDQNLKGWCVTNFSTAPSDFSASSGLATENLPVWGTCPERFYLATNNVTIKCDNAINGETKTINSITYTKRIKAQITTTNAATTCTSGITDMSNLFEFESTFNEDISHWDVSSVTNMSYMLGHAYAFNQDIGNWNVSSVTNMSSMFSGTSTFNANIGAWNVSNVTDMSSMFQGANAFKQDIGGWDVSSVINMSGTFANNSTFNEDIGHWDVDSVTTMRDMFYNTPAFNKDISSWNVSSVTTMQDMFNGATAFNQNLQPWCVNPAPTHTGFNTLSALASENLPLWGQACTEATITGTAGWRLLGLPAATTLRQLVGDNQIQGVAGGFAPSANSNVFTYGASGVWQVPLGIDSTLASGIGLALYFFDIDSLQSKKLPAKLTVAGNPPTTDVQVPLNKTIKEPVDTGTYFSLVGNPYASNFNVSGLTADAGTMQDNIHFWNGTSYQLIDRTTGAVIPPFQGFWVEVDPGSAAQTLTFPAASKTTDAATQTHLKAPVASQSKGYDVNFELSGSEAIDKALRIAFRPYATLGFDRADASKLTPLSSAYVMGSFVGEHGLKSVESLPVDLSSTIERELVVQTQGINEELTLSWEGLENSKFSWSLHDRSTDKTINMHEQSSYTFELDESIHQKVAPVSALESLQAQHIAQKSKTGEQARFIVRLAHTPVGTEESEKPLTYELQQNYPNPFNPSTHIAYSLEKPGMVRLKIYNVMGQLVSTLVEERKTEGRYNVQWNAGDIASGVYYYRLEVNNKVFTKKMTLIK